MKVYIVLAWNNPEPSSPYDGASEVVAVKATRKEAEQVGRHSYDDTDIQEWEIGEERQSSRE